MKYIGEFDSKKAMEMLVSIALEREYSIRQLSHGVYDSSKFNQMCNGTRTPSYSVILKLCRKLEIDPSLLFQYSTTEEYNIHINAQRILLDYYRFRDIKPIQSFLEQIKMRNFDQKCILFLQMQSIIHFYTNNYKAVIKGITEYFRIYKKEDYLLKNKNYKLMTSQECLLTVYLSIALYKCEKIEESLKYLGFLIENNTIDINIRKLALIFRAKGFICERRFEDAKKDIWKVEQMNHQSYSFLFADQAYYLLGIIFLSVKSYDDVYVCVEKLKWLKVLLQIEVDDLIDDLMLKLREEEE